MSFLFLCFIFVQVFSPVLTTLEPTFGPLEQSPLKFLASKIRFTKTKSPKRDISIVGRTGKLKTKFEKGRRDPKKITVYIDYSGVIEVRNLHVSVKLPEYLRGLD